MAAPTKKRPRPSTVPAAPAAVAAPPSPSPSPATPPARPLSAVAARRAAREAAQAASQAPAPAAVEHEQESERPPLEEQEEEPHRTSRRANGNGKSTTTTTSKSNGSSKSKGKQPARYFAPPEPATAEEEDEVMLVDSLSDEEGSVSPPEGLDDEPEPAVLEEEVEEGQRTPREGGGKRRRREKSAFVDPLCLSTFQLVEGVNTFRTVLPADSSLSEGEVEEVTVFALQEGESLVLHGTALLYPLFGTLGLHSASLPAPSSSSSSTLSLPPPPSAGEAAAWYPLFAPSTHPLSPLSAAPVPVPASSSPARTLLLPGHGKTQSQELEVDLTRFAAAVVVANLRSGLDGLERCLVQGGVGAAGGMWPRPSRSATRGADEGRTWKLILSPTPSLTLLRPLAPQLWDQVLDAVLPSSAGDPGRMVVLVEGPKRVGKSTVARGVVNELLGRYRTVAYLDLDLGQPESTPPGFVSLSTLSAPLLGPAFTHPSLPRAAHYLGLTSPAAAPAQYVEAVEQLVEAWRMEVEFPVLEETGAGLGRGAARRGRYARAQESDDEDADEEREKGKEKDKVADRVPLVVNTHGWVKGLGADLLQRVKSVVQPSVVLSFTSPDAADEPYAPEHAGSQSRCRTVYLPPAPPSPLESKFSPADYRLLSLVSHLHALFPSPSPASASSFSTQQVTAWDFSLPLVRRAPLAVPLSPLAGAVGAVHLVGPSAGEVGSKHVLHVLNGAVVALVASPSSTPSSSKVPYDPHAPPPNPATSRALGLAVVRSLAPSAQGPPVAHFVTPIPASVLAAHAPLAVVCATGAQGTQELPLPLMLDYSASASAGAKEGEGVVEGGEAPWLSREEEFKGQVGGKRRVRRNLMRRGQA
ncbi:hypothetical protein JCM10207_006214 [Rhodosporidiobolus poonsookiae]